jgi:hypothetical protein
MFLEFEKHIVLASSIKALELEKQQLLLDQDKKDADRAEEIKVRQYASLVRKMRMEELREGEGSSNCLKWSKSWPIKIIKVKIRMARKRCSCLSTLAFRFI